MKIKTIGSKLNIRIMKQGFETENLVIIDSTFAEAVAYFTKFCDLNNKEEKGYNTQIQIRNFKLKLVKNLRFRGISPKLTKNKILKELK